MMGMLKKFALTLLLAACVSCTGRAPELAPRAGPFFTSLSVKFNYRDGDTRQSGRVSWRFDEESSRFIFFTPINQVGLELDVAGERAFLVNHSRKNFWSGDFTLLLDRLWGIGLPLSELRSLLVAGAEPPGGFAERGIAAVLERDPAGGKPRSVVLSRGAARLSLRVLKSETRPGKVVLIDYSRRYREDSLEGVLEE
jgi:hypothetical protein